MCADLDGWTLRTHRYLKVLQLKMGPVSQLVLPQNNLIRNHSKPILHTETMKDIGDHHNVISKIVDCFTSQL